MLVFPNAKINLGLNVVERRPDGYHNLETIFYPIPLQDVLEIVTFDENPNLPHPTDCDFMLHASGIPVIGKPEENLVVRAYHLLKVEFPIPPIHIFIYKQNVSTMDNLSIVF